MSPSVTFAGTATTKSSRQSIYTPPVKKQKMSITQTYFLAHSARGKLSREAARGDHDLRLLVGHANMLDSLMIDLANAEQEQERWFNRSLSGARDEEEIEVHHEATIVEEPEAEWEADDAESTDEETEFQSQSTTDHDDMEVDDEDDEELTLTRSPSRHSPPELSIDYDSDSEDEHMPPSPPNATLDAAMSTSLFSKKNSSISPMESESLIQQGFYLPTRSEPTIIAAY